MSRYLVSQAERSHKDFFFLNNNSSQRELGPPVDKAKPSRKIFATTLVSQKRKSKSQMQPYWSQFRALS